LLSLSQRKQEETERAKPCLSEEARREPIGRREDAVVLQYDRDDASPAT
jgi:hypothetical protein